MTSVMDGGNIVTCSPNLKYTNEYIEATYTYHSSRVVKSGPNIVIKPTQLELNKRTKRNPLKLGVMPVGWGGNNGTTFTAGILANKHNISWRTKNGKIFPNWYGSLTQAATMSFGLDEKNQPVFVPISSVVPMVHPATDEQKIIDCVTSVMDGGNIITCSPNVKYTNEYIEATYTYHSSRVVKSGPNIVVKPTQLELNIRTKRNPLKLGVMLVGWGGNNGTTFTAGILANKHNISWRTKNGEIFPNWYGSLTQAATMSIGLDEKNQPVFVPISSVVPMVHPDDIIIDGWDISALPLDQAIERAKVLDVDLQQKLTKYTATLKPRKSIYYEDFIAANQKDRADNLLQSTNKWEHLEIIRSDIRDCKRKHGLDKVIIVWTANTECFSSINPSVNDTADNLIQAIKANSSAIAPSTIFAVAAILENCPFINGSPQNTLVPGCVELANRYGVFIGGDDFKTGQTKIKSVLVDFLISAGIKPLSIASYNHLGNNDGKNLSSPKQFRSKEVSKSNVIDDMLHSNGILYKPGETPDHCVVIKYIEAVGDSKRAMDEYTSELMLGGRNTMVIHNTCEDSLLAAPVILDLIIFTELCERICLKYVADSEYSPLNPILSILGYFCKAPIVQEGTPIVNSLFRQRACIENILRACIGLAPENNMLLECKVKNEILSNTSVNINSY